MIDSNASETPHWVEVQLLVPETDPLVLEVLEQAILAVTPGGFASESWDAPPLPGEREPVPVGMTRYLVYVAAPELERASAALSGAVAGWPTATVTTAPLAEDWRERWKRYFVPLEASPRFIVTPPWEEPEVPAGQYRLVIEPAMAFGTAQHETTALCLEAIDGAYDAERSGPKTVLDVGSGTGILALAAAMLGAERALGVDVDPAAVLAARENVCRNPSLAGRDVRFDGTPVESIAERFELVVANILTPTLLMMAPAIASRVAAGGLLFLSGILVDQAPEVIAAYVAHGLEPNGTSERNGWIRVDLRRPAT